MFRFVRSCFVNNYMRSSSSVGSPTYLQKCVQLQQIERSDIPAEFKEEIVLFYSNCDLPLPSIEERTKEIDQILMKVATYTTLKTVTESEKFASSISNAKILSSIARARELINTIPDAELACNLHKILDEEFNTIYYVE